MSRARSSEPKNVQLFIIEFLQFLFFFDNERRTSPEGVWSWFLSVDLWLSFIVFLPPFSLTHSNQIRSSDCVSVIECQKEMFRKQLESGFYRVILSESSCQSFHNGKLKNTEKYSQILISYTDTIENRHIKNHSWTTCPPFDSKKLNNKQHRQRWIINFASMNGFHSPMIHSIQEKSVCAVLKCITSRSTDGESDWGWRKCISREFQLDVQQGKPESVKISLAFLKKPAVKGLFHWAGHNLE